MRLTPLYHISIFGSEVDIKRFNAGRHSCEAVTNTITNAIEQVMFSGIRYCFLGCPT